MRIRSLVKGTFSSGEEFGPGEIFEATEITYGNEPAYEVDLKGGRGIFLQCEAQVIADPECDQPRTTDGEVW